MPSEVQPPLDPQSTDGPHAILLGRIRVVLLAIAGVCAVIGFVAVLSVIALGLSGQPVPSWFVPAFLALLPAAFLALGLTVILGVIQRRLN